MQLTSLALLVGLALGAAVPEPAKPKTTPFCSAVQTVVTALHAQSAATAFCSSYLHLTATTVTSTVATVFPTDFPCYAAAVTKRDASYGEVEKRSVSKPSCFKSYTQTAQLSSACSCLSIPVGTSTVSASATSSNFIIKAAYNSNYAVPAIYSCGASCSNSGIKFSATSPANAFVFTLEGDNSGDVCVLRSGSTEGYAVAYQQSTSAGGAADELVVFSNGFSYQQYRHTAVGCHIARGTNTLTCSSGQGNVMTEQDDYFFLGDGTIGSPLAFTAIPV